MHHIMNFVNMLGSKCRTIIWPRNGTGFHIVPGMTSKTIIIPGLGTRMISEMRKWNRIRISWPPGSS